MSMTKEKAVIELRKLTFLAVHKAIEGGFTAEGLNWKKLGGATPAIAIAPKTKAVMDLMTYRVGDRTVKITIEVI